jgi:SAM-dependent methyltransferase
VNAANMRSAFGAAQLRKEEGMDFINCYEDASRAGAYATLEFANTYYLAYRDLPAIMSEHVTGTKTLDFGCGTGRSTRFVRTLGFDVAGVDISEDMLRVARALDPSGDYRLVPGDNLSEFTPHTFDLIVSLFTFDNVPGAAKVRIYSDLVRLLRPAGTIVSVVSSPDIYTHEWASFTTKGFLENASARSGDVVRIVVTDHPDQRPVEDVLWTDESYRAVHKEAGLKTIYVSKPLAKGDEPFSWVNETKIPPWVIYVLKQVI